MMSTPVHIAPNPGATFPPPSLTARDWNIPPRPKPGRKPAGDAPPTKRKAQNREAQRAFRERRAQRVGELEEQLKESQEAAQRENGELRMELSHLHENIQHYTNRLASLQQRQTELEVSLTTERRLRHQAETRWENVKRQMNGSDSTVPLPLKKKAKTGEPSDGDRFSQNMENALDGITCGKCNGSSRCECIEEFAAMLGDNHNAETLDEPSPSEKDFLQEQDVNEIDFTARFTSQRSSNRDHGDEKSSAEPSPRETDPCGFCRNDSECICAVIARGSSQQSPPKPLQPTTNGAVSQNPSSSKLSSSCTNNPGTCAQCRSDPNSTVFCKTLAASRAQAKASGAGRSKIEPQEPNASASGPTLSCADAFSALSRHHAFPQASEQLGSWVPQLTSVTSTPTAEGRTAFEIEAANVMSVLKFFDNRFGHHSSEAKD